MIYLILEATTATDLETKVNTCAAQGYNLHGGLIVYVENTVAKYVQAMYK